MNPFFLNKTLRIEPLFFNVTSKNWTSFVSDITKRIEPLKKKTLRIEPFFFIRLKELNAFFFERRKELNPFLFDVTQRIDFLTMTLRIEPS